MSIRFQTARYLFEEHSIGEAFCNPFLPSLENLYSSSLEIVLGIIYKVGVYLELEPIIPNIVSYITYVELYLR